MMTREVILVSLLLSSYMLNVQCESLSLIGSRLVSRDGNPEVLISAKEFDGNSDIKVSFKAGDSLEDIATYPGLDGDLFEKISIPVSKYPEYDSYEVTLSHHSSIDEITKQQTVKLFNPLRHPFILIQTDKAAYDIGDLINFRVFVLNQKFVPLDYKMLTVTIKDANNRTIKEFSNKKQSEFGVYTNSLKLSQRSSLGKWKIEVSVDGKKKSKTFDVQKNLGIQIDLKCNKDMSYADQTMQMNLNIEKLHKKSFSGTAKISVVAGLASNNRVMIDKFVKSVNVVNGNNILAVDLERDLGLLSLSYDYVLKFTVEVIENGTRTSSKVYATVNVHKQSRLIEVNRSKYFRPGFEFPVEILVKTFSGNIDQAYENLKVTIEYLSASNHVLSSKNIEKKVFNGQVNLELMTTVDVKKILLKMKYRQTEMTEKIEAIPIDGDEYLQITADSQSNNVDETVYLTAKTTASDMQTLYVMVIGPYGMVYQKDYPEVEGKDVFKFPVKITEKMIPTSNIVAYYIKSNGDVVYDGYILDVGISTSNTLRIDTVSTAKPNENVEIKIGSENGTKVFLAAVSGNVDANKDIKDFLKNKSNTKLKFRDLSGYDFAQFDAFILEPLKTEENPPDKLEEMASNVEETAMDLIFSNVWFFEDIESQGRTSLTKNVPEFQATWQISGFSMHPSKGLSLASSIPTIAVKLDLSATIHAPEWIYKGEIVQIDYNVHNFLSHSIDANVKINIRNGRILNANNGVLCYDESKGAVQRTETISLPAESESEFNALYIVGDGIKPTEITVEVSSGIFKDVKKRVINVVASSKSQTSVKSKQYDDVLQAAMDFMEMTLSTPMEYVDYKIYKFAASVISYKYFTGQESQNSRQVLEKSYSEILPVLKDLTELRVNSNLKLIAYITESLIDARELITVDESIIKDALNYIANKQKPDGSFPYNSEIDSRRDVGNSASQITIQDALIILPFLKNDQFKSEYKNVIAKTIKRLKDLKSKLPNDYEKVIVANALMHNGENLQLSSFNVKNNYKTSKFAKLKPMLIEVVSYIVNLESRKPVDELKWLINEMYINNGFYSPYDAILATKALHDASANHRINLNNIKPTLRRSNQTLSDEFILVVSKQEINEILEINIAVTYKAPIPKNRETPRTNLVVIEAMLPSGYKFSAYKERNVVKQADVQDDGRLVLIYVEKMENGHKHQHKIYATKNFSVFKTAKSTVRVYDYYRSNVFKQVEFEHDVNENICTKPKNSNEIDYD